MPSLGADMESGTLIAWHVAVGDTVSKGDIVAEVDTDKSVIDVETFAAGTVEEILVHEGQRVPVGTPLAIIGDAAAAGDRAPGPASTSASAATPEPAGHPPVAPPATAVSSVAGRRTAASPLARRHAAALGIDLAAVTGTGPGGAVTTADVERFAAARAEQGTAGPPEAVAPEAAEPVPSHPERPAAAPLAGAERHAALRRAIATSMSRSKREIPHYYLATDIDMSAALEWLDERNAVLPVTDRLLPAVVLLKATALALRETPDLNGLWEDGGFRRSEQVHLGVAISLRGGGLVAPAIHDADRLTPPELMAALRDLVGRARAGRLRSSETSDPTITVTNLGDQGVDVAFPVIYPPQVAIVGFGRIRERPWAAGGMVGARPVVTASLAADHRVTDGHLGAIFLTALERLLHTPEGL